MHELTRIAGSELEYDLLLAIDEVVTNAILHGGTGRGISVHVSIDDRQITATVADGGSGFDVAELVRSWPPAPDQESGRGIYLLTQLMDSVSIEAGSGTIVHMSRGLRSNGDRGRPICVWSSPTHARFSHDWATDARAQA